MSLFLCSVGKGERRLLVLLILDELFKLSLHNLTKLIFFVFLHHFGCSVGSMLLIFLAVCVVLLFVIYVLGSVL